MRALKRRAWHRKPFGGRIGEALESRLALSGMDPYCGSGSDVGSYVDELDFLTIVDISPAANSVVTSRPKTITIGFDRPLDEFSLGTSDIVLERLDSGSNVVWTLDSFANPLIETLDGSGTRLVVTLPADVGLEAGVYRISLSDSAFLMSTEGAMLADVGMVVPLGKFQIVTPGMRLGDAIDLGTIGATPISVAGFLDFAADPHAVALYRFQVSGHGAYRVGVEVLAQRLGSSLDAAIAIFDAQGNLIAATDDGLFDAPRDPFLFRALASGTYYIGVSGTGNVAGRAGSYNPALGLPELVHRTRDSGAFELNLVADLISDPTRLVSFEIQTLDAQDASPTGFTLGFSGIVTPGSIEGEDALLFPAGVELVDANGRVWPVAPNKVSIQNARIEFVLGERLPAGVYTIRLAERGGLVDLAGNPPIASGMPTGVLATFKVERRRSAHGASDLGASFPESLARGIDRAVSLQPGESIEYRAVNLREQFLRLVMRNEGGSILAEVLHTGTGESWSFNIQSDPNEVIRLLRAAPGSLVIRFTATGSDAATLHWTLSQFETNPERIVLSGVGQGQALNLRLVRISPSTGNDVAILSAPAGETPLPGASSPARPSGPLVPVIVTPIIPATIVLPGGGAGAPDLPGRWQNPVAPATSSLYLSLGGDPVGRLESGQGGAATADSMAASDEGTPAALPNQGGQAMSALIPARSSGQASGRRRRGEAPAPHPEPADRTEGVANALTINLDAIPAPEIQESWLDPWVARIAALLGTDGAAVERRATEHPAAELASIMPLPSMWRNGGSKEQPVGSLRNDLMTTVSLAIGAAVVIGGRRRLTTRAVRRASLRSAAIERLRRSERMLPVRVGGRRIGKSVERWA